MKHIRSLFIYLTIALLLFACGSPTPTAVPATQQPAAVQPAAPNGKVVSSNGVEFAIPAALGTDAAGSLIPERLAEPNTPDPGQPAYLQFKLQGYPVNAPGDYAAAQVQVMSTSANVTAMNGDVNKINAIIAAPSMSLTKEVMPTNYLIMASNMKTLSSADGSVKGARMLAIHGNGLVPVTNDGSLAYQFHGVTSDGKYYVIVQLPITAPFLQANASADVPAGGVAMPLNGDGNVFTAYYEQVAGLLNAAEASGTLSPTIAQMDALVQSLKINGAAVMLPAPLPTPTQGAEEQPAPATGDCDAAQFILDVTIPDGTVLKPNEAFTKTWRVKNTGSCAWDSSYLVAYVSGTAMSQSPQYQVVSGGGAVAPGGVVDVSVGMTAPSQPGSYTANWQIQNAAGKSLAKFYLTLKVQDQNSGGGSATGQVLNVVPQIVLEQGSGAPCTANSTYFVYVDITADANVKADYRIDLTDGSGQVVNGVFASGAPEETGTELFYSAETRRISLHVTGPYSYPDSVTVRVYVNGKSWGSAAASCQ